ncbi:MAG: bile acid:sodium symporter family protein [Chloroflexaceae bacterium]|jgi:BASS family bile acid:Na+ symporter|nr:bile acid:sodium symporter family protein [Chloroflexaceae bacterium]
MEQSVITDVFLPLAIAIIMLGVGMSLTVADFKQVVRFPIAAAIGILCQLVLTPLIAFGIAWLLNLPPLFAVGMIVLASCPGGPTSNLITYLARGDMALSVSVSAISNVATAITAPLYIAFAVNYFLGQNGVVEVPLGRIVLQVILLTVVPVGLGMLLRVKKPGLVNTLDDGFKLASLVLLFLVIMAAVIRERNIIVQAFLDVGPATLLLNVGTMGLGFVASYLLSLRWSQGIALPIEVGIQNGVLAIALANTLAISPDISVVPAIYSLIMLVTAPLFAFFINVRVGRRTCACCRDKFRLAFFDLNRTRGEPEVA